MTHSPSGLLHIAQLFKTYLQTFLKTPALLFNLAKPVTLFLNEPM